MLINRRFQLRFAFYVCSWLMALSFSYPLIISNLFDYFLRYLASDPMGPAIASLEKTRVSLLWLLIIMQIILLSLSFLISVFMSHKIAGPLYKLRMYFAEAATGNLSKRISFRQKDYFQELAQEFNAMMDGIQKRLEIKDERIRTVLPILEQALENSTDEARIHLTHAIASLKEIQKG